MLIKNLEVKNFRSIRAVGVEIDHLTILVGRNGAGKSSLLWALDYFYDVSAPATIEDYFNHDTNSPIEVRVTYGELNQSEIDEFGSYLSESKQLVVKKQFSWDSNSGKADQKYFATLPQLPEFAEIRTMSTVAEKRSKWAELIESKKYQELKPKFRSMEELSDLMTGFEVKHPELLRPFEKREQFFGPRNVGGGKLDKFTKFVFVPAVREVADETSQRKGAVARLIETIVSRKINARADVQSFREEFKTRVKEVFSSENLSELQELGATMSKTLEKFSPGAELLLQWGEVEPPEVQLPPSVVSLVEDGFEGDINRKGHGLQRALIMTLLQHLAMIESPYSKTVDSGADGVSESSSASIVSDPDLILAIEEPELYLHPSRCKHLAQILLSLIEKPGEGLGARNQVLHCTHSPYFVELRQFDSVRKFRKVRCEDVPIKECKIGIYGLTESAKELARINNRTPDLFTRNSFTALGHSVMNPMVNEGFFADLVVVVEGPGDLGILWALQEELKMNWTERCISVIPASGKSNMDRPIVVFRGLEIPTYFVFDGDKGKEGAAATNHSLLKLAGHEPEDSPPTQVHDNWAVVERNLEAQLALDLGTEIFEKVRGGVAHAISHPNPAKLFKSALGSAAFVREACQQSLKLSTHEDIVKRVTAWHEEVIGISTAARAD